MLFKLAVGLSSMVTALSTVRIAQILEMALQRMKS